MSDQHDDVSEQRQIDEVLQELETLRRRLDEQPGRVEALEERLLEAKGRLSQAISQNEKLSLTLQQAKEQLAALRDEVEKLSQPPSAYGTFVGMNPDGSVDVVASGRKMRVSLHPDLDPGQLRRGDEVVLNESLNVVLVREGERSGEVVKLKELLEGGQRAIIFGRGDEERVCDLAEAACSSSASTDRRSRSSSSRRSPTSLTTTSEVSMDRSRPSPMLSSCRICTVSSSARTGSLRPRESSSMDRRGAARRSSPRQSPTRWRRRSPRSPATPTSGAISSTSRALSCSTSTSARQSGRSGSSSSELARRQRRGCR